MSQANKRAKAQVAEEPEDGIFQGDTVTLWKERKDKIRAKIQEEFDCLEPPERKEKRKEDSKRLHEAIGKLYEKKKKEE